jgi:hypothetical protein
MLVVGAGAHRQLACGRGLHDSLLFFTEVVLSRRAVSIKKRMNAHAIKGMRREEFVFMLVVGALKKRLLDSLP